MRTYTVRTGGYTGEVEADSPFSAVCSFLANNKFDSIGLISSAQCGEEEESYVSNERALKSLGMWEGFTEKSRP